MYSNLVFVVGILLIALAATPMIGQESQRDINRAEIQTGSFLVYRDAARQFIIDNPGYTGTLDESDLDLPDHYKGGENWNSRADSGTVWIYGDLPSGGLRHAVDQLDNPVNLGKKEGGTLVSPAHGNTGITVPGFVDEGQVAAVIKNT